MSGTMTYLFANMLLNSRLQGVFSSILIAPLVAISIGGVFVSRRFGLKSTFLLGTWGSMTMLAIMFVVGPDPNVPAVFLGMFLAQKCLASMVCFCIVPILGHIATIIAMRWHNLDKVKMAEIQEELENRKEVRTGKGPHLNGATKAAAGEAV